MDPAIPVPVPPPEVSVVASSEIVPPPKKSPKFAIVIILLIVVLLGICSFLASYLIATERLAAPNVQIKQAVSSVIFKLPFIPKTPGFVIDTFAANDHPVTQSSFDLSLSVSSNDLKSMLGASKLDIQVAGYADFSDSQNPLADIKVDVTNFFAGKFKKTTDKIYFKIDKVPSLIAMYTGLSSEALDPLIKNWISTDYTVSKSEASELLKDSATSQSPVNEAAIKAFKKIFTQDIRTSLKMSEEKIGSDLLYKIEFSPTAAQLDKIWTELEDQIPSSSSKVKPSQVLSKVHFAAWLDQLHQLRKITFTASYNPPSQDSLSDSPYTIYFGSFSSAVDMALVLNISDHGKTLPVTPPTSSITAEEFYAQISALMMTARESSSPSALIPDPVDQLSNARNARRRSDVSSLHAAVQGYLIDNHNVIPSTITTTPKYISKSGANLCSLLVGTYLSALPPDTQIGDDPPVTDCNSTYNTGYFISRTADNKITIAAPLAEAGETISITR